MIENKKDKFKRMAERRTNSRLDKVRLLGNLSNSSNYYYEEEDVRKIFFAIDVQLKNAKSKFHFGRKKFKL